MLFNSYPFLLAFLPVTLLGFALLARTPGSRAPLVWLTSASLVFYGWWEPAYLALLLASIAFNYTLALVMARAPEAQRGRLLALGVMVDLLALGVFKYLGFVGREVGRVLGRELPIPDLVLPLAISFFTFQQIAYLVDCRHDPQQAEGRFLPYLFFVSFFPQLIAGPIVHHSEMMPQVTRPAFRLRAHHLAVGISLFAVGLFKKVVLADGLDDVTAPVFDGALAGTAPGAAAAWVASVGYGLQLYFDFSGYTDMAIGLGRMFGLHLPLNFDSPYKATSIIDFWRRWHMTLSRFLRDCLYIPLGGNRRGPARRYVNLMITMLLGGLWHGAHWNFVIWGGLHGLYLLVNHAFRALRGSRPSTPVGRAGAWLLTFGSAMLAWVFFRAESYDAAVVVLGAMAGLAGAPGGAGLPDLAGGLLVAGAFGLAVLGPNSQEIFRRVYAAPGAGDRPAPAAAGPAWRPTPAWAAAIGVALALALAAVHGANEFVYFQF